MKKEIMAYITALIDMTEYKCLGDLWDFVDDFEEENTDAAEDKARYVNRIQELEEANENFQERVNYLKGTSKQPVSATLSLQVELQELKSKLAESEESLTNMMDNENRLNKRVEKAERDCKAWKASSYALSEYIMNEGK